MKKCRTLGQSMKWSVLAIASTAMIGCGSLSENNTESAQGQNTYTPNLTACGESVDAATQIKLDRANELSKQAFENMQNSGSGNFQSIQASIPDSAVKIYDEVLAKNPKNCDALAGKAVLSLANLSNNQDMKDFMRSLDSLNGDTLNSQNSYTAMLNSSGDQAPQILLKTQVLANQASPITITRIQNMIAKSALPIADTAISRLESVMAAPDFALNIKVGTGSNEHIVQIDKGEVGPALATLKLIKALMLSIVSINAEIALDGNYNWTDTLKNIQDEDFDHLSAGQKKALDHLLAMTEKSSVLSTIKPEFANQYAAIPSLLESAITNLQDGLKYGIEESKTGLTTQANDVYIVLDGKDGDVSPKTLDSAVIHLESFKKYLKGNVKISFNKGKNSVDVNIPKFFTRTTGIQAWLPYHKVLDYSLWNDYVYADTTWSSYVSGQNQDNVLKELNISYGSIYFNKYDSTYTVNNYDVNKSSSYKAISSNLCQFSTGSKVVNVGSCRMNANGYLEFVEINGLKRGPFEFTNAAGVTTLNAKIAHDNKDLIDQEEILFLKNKVIFPDPTMGGIFPSLTNDNIWDTFDLIVKTGGPKETCTEINNTYYTYTSCKTSVLPSNPSDLDLLAYWFGGRN